MTEVKHRRPELYFHVGLGKTGTTYLQYHFFPKLKGVRYIQRTRYKEFRSIIESSKDGRLLFSREFDRQLEREVSDFASSYPWTRSIIILRPPEDWLASQYRRFVKNGFSGRLEDFVDVEGDRGLWSREELLFSKKVRALDEHFGPEPLVLLYEDLKEASFAFFDRIASYIGAEYDPESIDTSATHRSYSERQLKVMRRVSGRMGLEPQPKRSGFIPLKRVQEWWRRLLSYSVLYGSYLLPDSRIPDEPLIPEASLEKVRRFAREDWEYCRERANR
jgi:hypothetical protein